MESLSQHLQLVFLTFFLALGSFLVPLMKSFFPFRCRSYSAGVMSPFSIKTWGMWGSGNAENCVKNSCGYTLGLPGMQAPLAGKTTAGVSCSENPERGQDYLLGSLTLTILAKPALIQLPPELQMRTPGRGKSSRGEAEPTYHLDGSGSPRVCRRCACWPV